MPTAFICPLCGAAHTAHAAPLHCPKCQQRLPDYLRLELAAALAGQVTRMPLLLRAGRIIATTIGASLVLTAGLTLLRGSPTGDGARLALLVTSGAVAIAIGEGLRRERAWARPLLATSVPILGVVTAVIEAVAGEPVGVVVWTAAWLVIPSTAVAVAYLYRKESVVEYYRALELQHLADSPAPPVSISQR